MTLKNSLSNNEFSDPERRRLLEALEVCRPGTDDFDRLLDARTIEAVRNDAELTRRYGRLQNYDSAVARAFADASVPSGLEGRLLAALAADALVSSIENKRVETSTPSRVPTAAAAAAADGTNALASSAVVRGAIRNADSGGSPAATAAAVSPRFSRRGWLSVCGGAVAATAAGLVGLGWLRSDRPEWTLEQLLDQAVALHREDGDAPTVTVQLQSLPADYPLTTAFAFQPKVVRRRSIDGRLLGRPGVAYELAPVGLPRATLYVLGDGNGAYNVVGIPDQAGGHPDKPPSGNQAAGVWRENGRLYVFVVEGDEAAYRRYFERSTGVYA